jgi:hypothetical protein
MLMFSVQNADFIADKLAKELLPWQEYREVAKNAEEAVLRRIAEDGIRDGRIEFDVDWPFLAATGQWFVSCADNGDGMSRHELSKYMTTLAVEGAGQNQSLHGNQGMGLKISGPTRHKKGVFIRSLKNGEASAIQIGWNGEEYGAIPIGPDGEIVMPVDLDSFPAFVLTKGSGTVVSFLGNEGDENTFSPADRARTWLFKYLHQRFFRLSDDGVEVLVRVPTGDETEWPRTYADASDRQRGVGGRSFNLSKVKGTASIWDDAADRQGDGYRGTVELAGDAANDIPGAIMHWWVLPPSGSGTDVSSRTSGGGSIAVLYQNELHDWRTSNQANPFFARLGVLFGKPRIAFVLEPTGGTITSDFARAHVLVGGRPVFESDAWITWSDQFRAEMPERIKETMIEEQARLQAEDPDRAKRIRDRLKDVMSMLRPPRFRRHANGSTSAGGADATGPDGRAGTALERTIGPGKRKKTINQRGIGAVLTSQAETDGEPASEVYAILQLEPMWVTEKQAEGIAIVNGNGQGLHDRAAALAGEDGATANVLLLNREFRGYQAILSVVNDWANEDGDDTKAAAIESTTQEWIEQKMVEAVNGLRQLENGSTWVATNFDEALSPVALTAAFMADRYHTLREVRRAAGGMRQQAA